MLVAILLAWTTLEFITHIWAYPGTSLQSRRLPTSIPDCSSSCVQTFIQESYPTSICGDQQDLSCLCANSGSNGFTLGEGILRCVVSSCVDTTAKQFQQAYTICNNIPGAISPSHSVITVSMSLPSTIIIPAAAPKTVRSTFTTSSSITTTSTSSSLSTTASTASASAASVSLTSSSSSSQTIPYVLTRPQIIGISTGLGIAALIAMGLLIYICCFKQRQNRESSSSWGTNRPFVFSAESSDRHHTKLPQINPYFTARAHSILGQNDPIWSPITSPQRDYSINHMNFIERPRYEEIINPTPTSAATYHTTSKLLPDKPSSQAPPTRPPRNGAEGILLTVPSTNRIKRSPSRMKASPDSFNSGPILNKQPSDPFLRSPEGIYSIENERAARRNLPKLDTSSSKSIQPPMAAYNPADYAQFAESQVYSTSAGPNAFLPGTAMTTSLAISIPIQSEYKPPLPPKEGQVFDKNKPIPPSKRKIPQSVATSFEMDDDKVEETKHLSNVGNSARPEIIRKPPAVSSTTNMTPLYQIQYPTVPSLSVSPYHKRESTTPFDVSPMTPPAKRNGNIVLPLWEDLNSDSWVNRTHSIPRRPVQVSGYDSRSYQVRSPKRNPIVTPPSINVSDFSRYFEQEHIEILEQGSAKRYSPEEFSIPIQIDLAEDIFTPNSTPKSRHLRYSPIPSNSTATLPETLSEFSSPKMYQTSIIKDSTSPSGPLSRGAKLGAAVAKRTPQGQTQYSPPSNQRMDYRWNGIQSISNSRNLHLHPALRSGQRPQYNPQTQN